MDKWKIDPQLLKNNRMKIINDLLDATPGFVIHKKQIDQINKEIGNVELEIQKLQNKMALFDKYPEETERLNGLIEKHREKCESLKEEIVQKAIEQCLLEGGNMCDIRNIQIHGMTPYVVENKIKSLLLAQKVELKKLEYEYNTLKRNVFCIVDEDPSSFQIDQPLDLPDLYDDKCSYFNNLQSSVYANVELPISNAAKEISNLLSTVQTPEIDNGVSFTAAPTDYFDHSIKSKTLQAADLTYKLDNYSKNLSAANDATNDLCMKARNKIRKANDFDIQYEGDSPTRTAGAQYIRITAQKIKHSQEVLDSLIRSINNSEEFPPQIFEKENEIRNAMNELTKTISARVSMLEKESDLLIHPLVPPTAPQHMKLKNISDLQIERVSNNVCKLDNLLLRKAADVENLATLNEYEYEMPREESVDNDDDFNSKILEIINLQNDIMNKQNEQLDLIADIFETLPDLKQYDVEWPEMKSDPDDETQKVIIGEKVTEPKSKKASDKLANLENIKEMMSEIRSRQYTPHPPPPEPYPIHKIIEPHPIKEIFEKWKSQNLDGVEATNAKAVEENCEVLRAKRFLLLEEVEAAQKAFAVHRREAAAREKRVAEIEEAEKRSLKAEEKAIHARQTSDKINRIIEKKAKSLQNVEARIAALNDDIYALKIEADLEEKERMIKEIDAEIEEINGNQ